MTSPSGRTGEREELVEALGRQRFLLRHTLRDLTNEQAKTRTTASELTLGGILKHVTGVEDRWAAFIVEGPSAMTTGDDEQDQRIWQEAFRMTDAETVDGLLDAYAEVAARTDEIVMSAADLDADHPLPPRPWFRPGTRWSGRRVILHLTGETAQHAGHADIIRESLDGAKSMG